MHSRSISFRVLGTSLMALLLSLPLLSQSTAGRILGSVHDSTGAVLRGATVVISDVQRGTTRTVTTDQAGAYVAPDLPAGLYRVRAEALGFKTVERPNIELQVAKDALVDFQLYPGQVSETITVTDQVPLVETTNDVLGGTLSNRQINDLPLNGRDYQNLITLRPGVMRYPGGGIGSVSADGIRPEDNNFIVDGIDQNDPYFGQSVIDGAGVQGTPATILPIDAIQEFNDQENPPAEYGWKPGAIVNVGLKSGTNALHGTAYDFERNAALDARNFFNVASTPKKPLHLHQFGGTVGGPIVKDRLFFFVGYEGIRDVVGVTQNVGSPATVPLPDFGNCPLPATGDCANSVPDAMAGVRARGLSVSPLSQRLQSLFPTNPGTNPRGSTTITTGFPNTNRGDNGLIKLDFQLSDRNAVSGTYFIGDSLQTEQDQPVVQPQWESQATTRSQVLGMNWTSTPSSRWVNQARFGYNRLKQFFFTADHNVNPQTGYGIFTNASQSSLNYGMPEIVIAGFLTSATGGIFGGNSGWPQLLNPAQTFQFVDNVSHTRGKHAFKFGGEVRKSSVDHLKDRLGKGRVDFLGGAAWATPTTTSTPLEDFLAGVPTRGRIFVGNSHRQVSFWSYAAFVQDDWRVSPTVTVTAGLRYELNTVIKETHNQLGNFDANLGVVQVGQQISSPYKGDHNNFAPRLGIAWDVTGKGRTVIRAGGGVIYEAPHFDAFIGQFNMNNDPGTIGINIVPTAALGIGPGGANGSGTITAGVQREPGSNLTWVDSNTPVFNVPNIDCRAVPCDIFAVNRNLRTPYVTSWNLNVQQAITKNLALQVAYVGNHGTKLFSVYDINQIDPNSLAEKNCLHCEANFRFTPQFPGLGFINQLGNGYRSNYNGLQTTLTERASHGVSFIVGYTWSHALDQASDNRAPEAMNAFNPAAEYGSSDFDIRHRFTLTFTYDIPGRKSFAQLLEGWQLNSILTMQTGQPWNVVSGSDFSLTGEGGERWDFFGNPAAFKPSTTGIPFFAFGAPNMPAVCLTDAAAVGATPSLTTAGCYAEGNSVMIPPPFGTFGTMHRNIFRGPGLHVWDLSVVKNWTLTERAKLQFRGEFFNILNHPNFENPYGVNNTVGNVDATAPDSFGCTCATPDVGAGNPVIGTGGPRNIQLGLKVIF